MKKRLFTLLLSVLFITASCGEDHMVNDMYPDGKDEYELDYKYVSDVDSLTGQRTFGIFCPVNSMVATGQNPSRDYHPGYQFVGDKEAINKFEDDHLNMYGAVFEITVDDAGTIILLEHSGKYLRDKDNNVAWTGGDEFIKTSKYRYRYRDSIDVVAFFLQNGEMLRVDEDDLHDMQAIFDIPDSIEVDEKILLDGGKSKDEYQLDSQTKITYHYWYVNGKKVSEEVSFDTTFSELGEYIIRLEVGNDEANMHVVLEKIIKIVASIDPNGHDMQAIFTVADTVKLGEEIVFDGSNSLDDTKSNPDVLITNYHWYVNTNNELNDNAVFKRTFDVLGTYVIRLDVGNKEADKYASLEKTIIVIENIDENGTDMESIFTLSSDNVKINEVVTANGNGSLNDTKSNPDVNIDGYHWYINGVYVSSGSILTKSFALPGEYIIRLDVGNQEANKYVSSEKIVTVIEDIDENGTYMESIFTLSSTSIKAGESVIADGSLSTNDTRSNPDINIDDYRWYINGIYISSGIIFNQSFSVSGTYIIKLEVVNIQVGKNAFSSKTLTVQEDGNSGIVRPDFDYGNDYSGYSIVGDKVIGYCNVSLIQELKDKPFAYGNFSNIQNANWILLALVELPGYPGWKYFEIELQDNMSIYYGWGGHYNGLPEEPNFDETNYGHMKHCYGFNKNSEHPQDIYLYVIDRKIQDLY